MKKYAVNLILLLIGVVILGLTFVSYVFVTLMPVAVIAFALAYALGTSTKGKYNVLTPTRSLIFSACCMLTSVFTIVYSFTYVVPAEGETLSVFAGTLWVILAVVFGLSVILFAVAELLVRLGYRVFKGQKFNFKAVWQRGGKWLIIDVAFALLTVGAWILFMK